MSAMLISQLFHFLYDNGPFIHAPEDEPVFHYLISSEDTHPLSAENHFTFINNFK